MSLCQKVNKLVFLFARVKGWQEFFAWISFVHIDKKYVRRDTVTSYGNSYILQNWNTIECQESRMQPLGMSPGWQMCLLPQYLGF